MEKIIDLVSIIKAKKGAWYDDGVAAINNLDVETANRIMTFLLTYVVAEVRVGLNLVNVDEEHGKLEIYDKIAELYEEAAGSCYFCSELIDPNADEFDQNTILCPMCALKLANFVQALGIDPGKVLKGMAPRRVQKKRINY